ncbi:MAG TPA: hypothetical protein VGL74_05160 [Terriglobales bacterium]|jgi:hypothetical protein
MATFEQTIQPQQGVYGWYAQRNGHAITLYIGRAGKSGTLFRAISELLCTPFTSNANTEAFSSLDTNFVVGTAILYFEKNGWHCTWKHIANDPKQERIIVNREDPILQDPSAKIKKVYKLRKEEIGYWKKDRHAPRSKEAEVALFSILSDAVASIVQLHKLGSSESNAFSPAT